ncbi:citrate (Si)-synthase [Thermincola ferriacetica]|uniref:Citrate synthase n=1 Tax=Thermincola ferriacetica TaxID=281456 RepID=A0A0L6W391_9FIRM|nr:citrate/2-methylcitrate synthase [Thermincola ferriacetica]KNZ69911.1 citrate (Si)-synthase [Thermincola ferriacetica]
MSNKDYLEFIDELTVLAKTNNKINTENYTKYDVKKGLRNSNGTGVLVGLTEIGEVHGYIVDEEEVIPVEGRLTYRGINIQDIVNGFQKEGRHGFEEVCYLLLFGQLPNAEHLAKFRQMMGNYRILPEGFMRDMILKAPSKNIMNKLARSVLACYSYDPNPDDIRIKNVLRQSIELIARFPVFVAYGYQALAHYHKGQSMFIHKPRPELSTAENFLYMIRQTGEYTKTEADLLDLSLVLHAEHGGGNNSAFTTRVVSSTGTDTYSAIAAAVGSLKGPKHGGANLQVMKMMENIKEHVTDWTDEEEIEWYLEKILTREAFDKSGLIYGLGHAVYTLSDPRAVLLKKKAFDLAQEKNRLDEFNLYTTIEKLAPKVFVRVKKSKKHLCVNVDFYSGFVYDMLGIPSELCTPLFAISRIAGWCAHRLEELISVKTIMRPAYKSVVTRKEYVPLAERQ